MYVLQQVNLSWDNPSGCGGPDGFLMDYNPAKVARDVKRRIPVGGVLANSSSIRIHYVLPKRS